MRLKWGGGKTWGRGILKRGTIWFTLKHKIFRLRRADIRFPSKSCVCVCVWGGGSRKKLLRKMDYCWYGSFVGTHWSERAINNRVEWKKWLNKKVAFSEHRSWFFFKSKMTLSNWYSSVIPHKKPFLLLIWEKNPFILN